MMEFYAGVCRRLGILSWQNLRAGGYKLEPASECVGIPQE